MSRMEGTLDRGMNNINRNINMIARWPARPIGARNNNNAGNQNDNNNGANNNPNPTNPATLSPHLRTLHQMWQEYEIGIGGRKAARLFLAVERGRVKYTYHRRKVLWDAVQFQVLAGHTAELGIDRIYTVYGKNTTVSRIINRMRQDRALYPPTGLHPQL
jgi:hypothetical protein